MRTVVTVVALLLVAHIAYGQTAKPSEPPKPQQSGEDGLSADRLEIGASGRPRFINVKVLKIVDGQEMQAAIADSRRDDGKSRTPVIIKGVPTSGLKEGAFFEKWSFRLRKDEMLKVTGKKSQELVDGKTAELFVIEPIKEPVASRPQTPAEVAKMLMDGLSADARRWMVMYVNGSRLRLAPLLSDDDNEAVKMMLSREEVKKWIVDEDTRAGHPEGPKAPPIPQPSMSAATAKQRRAEVIAASEAADKLIVKEVLSADAKTWLVMYVNGHLLRNAPLLSQADHSAVKKMLARDEVNKWVAAEDAYAGPKK
jgi:hypothetical protein